jgi:hypothetical protein
MSLISKFKIFENNLNRFGYQQIILEHIYLFLLTKFGNECFVHQENDPKHTSRICQQTYLEYDIKIVKFCILIFNCLNFLIKCFLREKHLLNHPI